jgi:hypothetical protein
MVTAHQNIQVTSYQNCVDRVEKPVNRVQNLFRREFLPTLWCGIRDVAPNDQAVSAIYPHLVSSHIIQIFKMFTIVYLFYKLLVTRFSIQTINRKVFCDKSTFLIKKLH